MEAAWFLTRLIFFVWLICTVMIGLMLVPYSHGGFLECDKTMRIDYIAPVRPLACWLGEEMH